MPLDNLFYRKSEILYCIVVAFFTLLQYYNITDSRCACGIQCYFVGSLLHLLGNHHRLRRATRTIDNPDRLQCSYQYRNYPASYSMEQIRTNALELDTTKHSKTWPRVKSY